MKRRDLIIFSRDTFVGYASSFAAAPLGNLILQKTTAYLALKIGISALFMASILVPITVAISLITSKRLSPVINELLFFPLAVLIPSGTSVWPIFPQIEGMNISRTDALLLALLGASILAIASSLLIKPLTNKLLPDSQQEAVYLRKLACCLPPPPETLDQGYRTIQ